MYAWDSTMENCLTTETKQMFDLQSMYMKRNVTIAVLLLDGEERKDYNLTAKPGLAGALIRENLTNDGKGKVNYEEYTNWELSDQALKYAMLDTVYLMLIHPKIYERFEDS